MLNSLSFSTFTTTFSNLWDTAKSYVNSAPDKIDQVEQERPSKKQKTYRGLDFKRLFVSTTLSLFNTIKNQPTVNLGLITLFADSVNAAYPTAANPMPTQYAQPNQTFSYDIDLNYVFNDTDGDIMTFGSVTMVDDSVLPSWLKVELILLGNYATPSNAYGIAVQNEVVYVRDYNFGLQLINVSNASAPQLLSTYDTSGYACGVVVQNGIAYVADYSFGLQIINVSNVSWPRLLGAYDTPNDARGVAVQNGVAYVADYTYGLQIISLKSIRLNAIIPFNATGNYSFKIHATNINGEWISTSLELRIGMALNTTLPSAPASTTFSTTSDLSTQSTNNSTINSQSASSNSALTSSQTNDTRSSLSSEISTTASENSISMTFSIITSSMPLGIKADSSTILTTEYLSVSGNVNFDQVTYTVLGNNPDILITVNGIEVTQFTQADVEGNFVELALQGVTCEDYSTDLKLEANVADSNALAQQVNIALTLQGTTCSNTGRLSAFPFREINIGFWKQKREVEQEPSPVQTPNHIPTLR